MLLKVHTEMEGETLRVTLAGELDGGSVHVFRAAVEQAPAGWECAAVDMRDVVFMDSKGLHELVRLNASARERGLQVTLVRPSPPVMRLLELTGLEAVFAVRD